MKKNFFLLVCFILIATAQSATIGVLNFHSLTGDSIEDAMLSVGTTETIISYLGAVQGIVLVERSQILKVNQEIGYNQSGMIDESTIQQVGRQIGANYLILGSWQKFAGNYRCNARIVETQTAQVVASALKTNADIFFIQDEVIKILMTQIQFEVSTPTPQTQSVDAYRMYSMAVKKAEYENDSKSAEQYAKKALQFDPNYSAPKKYIYYFEEDKKAIFVPNTPYVKEDYSAAKMVGRNIFWWTVAGTTLGVVVGFCFAADSTRNTPGRDILVGTCIGAGSGFVIGIYTSFKLKKKQVQTENGIRKEIYCLEAEWGRVDAMSTKLRVSDY